MLPRARSGNPVPMLYIVFQTMILASLLYILSVQFCLANREGTHVLSASIEGTEEMTNQYTVGDYGFHVTHDGDTETEESDPGYASRDYNAERAGDSRSTTSDGAQQTDAERRPEDSNYQIILDESNFALLDDEVKMVIEHGNPAALHHILPLYFSHNSRPRVFIQLLGHVSFRRDAGALRTCLAWIREYHEAIMLELSNQYGLMRLIVYAMERQYDDIVAVLFEFFPQDTCDTIYCSGMFTIINDSLSGLRTVWPYLRSNQAFLRESLREAAWKNQKDMVRFMVGSQSGRCAGDFEDALRAAIYHRDVEMVGFWLNESVDPRDPMTPRDGDTQSANFPCALSLAVAQGDIEILAMILDKDELVHPDKGIMPGLLETALSLQNYETAELLLARGADILEVSLDTAVATGRKETVKALLQSGRRDFQSALYGSVLQRACTLGDLETAKLLLEYGHAINPKSPMALGGNSPLMGAITGGHAELAEFLISEGAFVQGARSVFGHAIPTALWLNRKDVVRVLVEHTASCS
ncbi:hypothetical protein ASPCAL12504 [Aspergillus calidoustus]|uniref:Uncharacterized protein n=1 Tax=Aspergillus calidoustus TaxID=454130 RepID=A0A0U5GDP6_ASPCI|nr:hypothetical protein ASPCAL12504 [Aspergillus calidoustus]